MELIYLCNKFLKIGKTICLKIQAGRQGSGSTAGSCIIMRHMKFEAFDINKVIPEIKLPAQYSQKDDDGGNTLLPVHQIIMEGRIAVVRYCNLA